MTRVVRAVVAGALTALWGGCPDKGDHSPAEAVDAGPRQLAETEPNDRAEQALQITSEAIVTASLGSDPAKPDQDWYLLSPGGARHADVAVSGIAGADVVLTVFDRDKNALVTLNSEGEGKGERFPNLGVPERVYVRVTGAKKGSGGAYTLTVLFREPAQGFEQEPNDRAVDAHPLGLGQTAQAFLSHAADEDWYLVEVPPPPGADAAPPPAPATAPAPAPSAEGEDAGAAAAPESLPVLPEPSTALRIDVSAVPGVRIELSVLTAAEASLFQARSKESEALTVRNVGVRAADRTVFVVVKSAWSGTGKDARRGFNVETPYSIAVAVEAAGANAELESNDELARATPLPQEGFREGFISPATDVDYYVLRTERPVVARLQLSGVERMDLALEVVAPKEGGGAQSLMRANDGGLKEPEQLNDVACDGTCYFKVEGAARKVEGKWVRDFENAEQPYRLHVAVAPDDGTSEREPNNTAALATPLRFGQPVRGTVQPKRDVDYYRLDLSDRVVRTPILATLLGILKVDVGLYLHRVAEDGTLSLVQTADRAKGEQPESIRYSAEPGVYVFEVRDSTKRYESNFQDRYQLTVMEGS